MSVIWKYPRWTQPVWYHVGRCFRLLKSLLMIAEEKMNRKMMCSFLVKSLLACSALRNSYKMVPIFALRFILKLQSAGRESVPCMIMAISVFNNDDDGLKSVFRLYPIWFIMIKFVVFFQFLYLMIAWNGGYHLRPQTTRWKLIWWISSDESLGKMSCSVLASFVFTFFWWENYRYSNRSVTATNSKFPSLLSTQNVSKILWLVARKEPTDL